MKPLACGTAAEIEAAAIDEQDAEFFAMRATGWRLTDGREGPHWWRIRGAHANARNETRLTYLSLAEKIDWLLNRPEHENEPRVFVTWVHQREPKRSGHAPRFVARLNIHDGLRTCEGNSDNSLDEAVAKLVATVAMFESVRR